MFCGLETGTQKTQHSALSNWREHGMKDPEKMPTNGKEIWYCQDGAELHMRSYNSKTGHFKRYRIVQIWCSMLTNCTEAVVIQSRSNLVLNFQQKHILFYSCWLHCPSANHVTVCRSVIVKYQEMNNMTN